MCECLGLGALRAIRMSINLADKSVKHLKWVIEDVLVKVTNLVFPFDFVVLDMDEEVDSPIILGRPFLRTSRVLIDLEKGKLVLRIGGNEILFKFPLLPITLSKAQDIVCVINHETNTVFCECVGNCSKKGQGMAKGQ